MKIKLSDLKTELSHLSFGHLPFSQREEKNNINKQAITIVELIVVITILAILGTISFIAFQSYTVSARDVVRINDLNNIKSTLEYAQLELGVYAIPDESVDVTFSGTTIWTQGIFGKKARTQTKRLDKVPVDPLTLNEYTFSTTANKTEYELGTILESGDSLSHTRAYTEILNKSYAAGEERSSYIIGNYNGQVLKTSTGGFDYVLAVPTIIASELTSTDITQIVSNKKLAVKGSRNLPSSYGTQTTPEDEEDLQYVNAEDLIAYKGKFSDLQTLQSERVFLASNIQKAYSGTLIATQGDISPVTSITIDIASPNSDAKKVADETVVYRLGLELKEEVVSSDNGVVEWILPEDLTQLFASDSQFTQNWETNNCDPANMTVVDVAPGTDTIYAANGNKNAIPENTILKLEEGIYIGGAIDMNNCSAIIGKGEETKYFTENYSSYSLYNQSSKNNFIVYGMDFDGKNDGNGGVHNSNMEGIKIETGNNTLVNLNIKNSYQRGVSFSGDNLVLSDIAVSNSEDREGISGNGDNLLISNISIFDSFEIGFYINANDSKFYNINTLNSGRNGFELRGNNNIVKGVSIKKSGSNGMSLNGTGGDYSDIVIEDPSMTFVGHGLYIYVVSNAVFKNITVSGTKYDGIYIWKNSNNNTFENISSSFNDGNGVKIEDSSDMNLFTNITAHDNREDGIFNSSQTIGTSFENVTVYNNASKGMYSGNIKTLSGSILAYDNGDSGIQITSGGIENFEITDITAYNNASFGIRLKGDGTYPLQGKMIAYGNSTGMYLEGFSGATDDFSINAHENRGIGVFFEKTNGLIMTSNNLSLVGNSGGIAFRESHNNIVSNISITDSISSSFQSIRNDGSSNNNTFTDIEIITGGIYGLHSLGDNTHASNISISGSPRVGMTAGGNDSTYSNISIENSRVEGVNAGGDNLTLSGITVSNPGQYGFNFGGGDNVIVSNVTVSGSLHTGFQTGKLTNSNLSNIAVSDSQYRGISVYGDNSSFSDITVTNSASSGFYLSTGINNTVSNITSSGNGAAGIYFIANTGSTFENINSYNNEGEGIIFNSGMANNFFNNVSSYGNGGHGLEARYDGNVGNKYYGQLHLYNNTESNLHDSTVYNSTTIDSSKLAPGTDGLNGWSNGVLNTNP